METNIAAIEASLRERYASYPVEDLTDNFSETWNKASRANKQMINSRGGFYVYMTNNNRSHTNSDGTAGQGGDFPAAANTVNRRMTVNPIITRSTTKINSSVLAQDSADNRAVQLNAADFTQQQIDNMLQTYAMLQNFCIWGDGSYELARISAVNTGTSTITCNNSGNLYGVQMLEKNMVIDIYDSTLVTKRGTFTISANPNRGTLSFVTSETLVSMGIVSGDRIFPKDSVNYAWKGMKYLGANSGAFQGEADRTIDTKLCGINIDASSTTLTAAFLRRLVSSQLFKRNGLKTKAEWYMSSQADAYEATAYAMKQQSGLKADTGYDPDQLAYGGTRVNKEIHVQRDHAYYADLSYLDVFEMKPYGLERTNGQFLHRANARYGTGHAAAFYIYGEGMGNFGTRNPSALVAIAYGFSTSGLALGNEA